MPRPAAAGVYNLKRLQRTSLQPFLFSEGRCGDSSGDSEGSIFRGMDAVPHE